MLRDSINDANCTKKGEGVHGREIAAKLGLIRKHIDQAPADKIYCPGCVPEQSDREEFDRQHYDFKYVHREFLGDVRCLVFDVTPKKAADNSRFLGRQ